MNGSEKQEDVRPELAMDIEAQAETEQEKKAKAPSADEVFDAQDAEKGKKPRYDSRAGA